MLVSWLVGLEEQKTLCRAYIYYCSLRVTLEDEDERDPRDHRRMPSPNRKNHMRQYCE